MATKRWMFWTAGVLAILVSMRLESPAGRNPALWDLLRQGGLVVLMRHAVAPGFGDPPHFRLDDCSTQRNLSEAGRRQARLLGESFRRQKIPIEKVYASQWCRCKETAQIAFGAFQEHPALNSFFEQPGLRAAQTEALTGLILKDRPSSGNLVLVTHQVNITALTSIVPAEGDLVVVRLEDDGRISVLGRITASD
jgi:broad specificity phosphatase PhoE